MENNGFVQTCIPSCRHSSEIGQGSHVLTAAVGWRPRSRSLWEVTLGWILSWAGYCPSASAEPLCPALSPPPPRGTDGRASSNRLPRPLGLLGFGQWETPTGDLRAESRVQSLVPPAPLCSAVGTHCISLLSPSCAPCPFRPRPGVITLGCCLSLWVSLPLSPFVNSLFVKLSTSPFECTICLLLEPAVIQTLCSSVQHRS